MLSWVLQALSKEIFQKAVSQNKDKMVLFPMLIFFRNTGKQGNGDKGFESLCVCWNSLSMHLFGTWHGGLTEVPVLEQPSMLMEVTLLKTQCRVLKTPTLLAFPQSRERDLVLVKPFSYPW